MLFNSGGRTESERTESGYASETRDGSAGSQRKGSAGRTGINYYYTMNFMQGQGLAKSRSHAHV